MSDPVYGLKDLHHQETYAVLSSRPVLFSNSPVWCRPLEDRSPPRLFPPRAPGTQAV